MALIAGIKSSSAEVSFALTSLGRSRERCAWYNHESDIKAFSLKHPSALFRLEGEGERSEDIWHKYFKNGEMQVCRGVIAFAPFDESKLSQ